MASFPNLFGLPSAPSREGIDRTIQSLGQFGLRENGTLKGLGWLGPLMGRSGAMTELSAGVEMNGKEALIPLLVPTLSTPEIEWLMRADVGAPDFYQRMPPSIMQKAVQFAQSQMSAGRSPFKD